MHHTPHVDDNFLPVYKKGCKASATVKAMLLGAQTSSRAASVGELCLSQDFYGKDENRFIFPCLPRTRIYVCECFSEALSSVSLSTELFSSLVAFC